MLQSEERETEILLGNKQLVGIFFVVAILLGVAFGGGYMVGRNTGPKPTAVTGAQSAESASAKTAGATGTTVQFNGDNAPAADAARDNRALDDDTAPKTQEESAGHAGTKQARVLGSRPVKPEPGENNRAASEGTRSESFSPEPGQQFLQVAAVIPDEAVALADVLHKQGFKAHAVPKPGNPKIYRVLIGPVRDNGDLYSTREKLLKTGFREVITQRY